MLGCDVNIPTSQHPYVPTGRAGDATLASVLLALFLIDLAAGLYLFLPLVGRRNAGVKFYRLILIVTAALMIGAMIVHVDFHDAILIGLTIIVYVTLRYPKRLIFRIPAALLALGYIAAPVHAWRAATGTSWTWSAVGAISSIALLGSVNLAMRFGAWYVVVRGWSMDPLRGLTHGPLGSGIVGRFGGGAARLIPGVWQSVAIRRWIFFGMRGGWGLVGPLALYPMVWG